MDYSVLSDKEVQEALNRATNRHDWLIDNSDMGDDRIYEMQKKCDALEAELKKRGLRDNFWETVKETL